MINSTRSTYSFKEVIIKNADTDEVVCTLKNQVSYLSDNNYDTNEYYSDWDIGELPEIVSDYEDEILECLETLDNSDLEKQDSIFLYLDIEE